MFIFIFNLFSAPTASQIQQNLQKQQPYLGHDQSILPTPISVSNCDVVNYLKNTDGSYVNGVLPKRWCHGFNSGLANPQENFMLRMFLAKQPTLKCSQKLSTLTFLINMNESDFVTVNTQDSATEGDFFNSYFKKSIGFHEVHPPYGHYLIDDEVRSYKNPFMFFQTFYLNEMRKVKPVISLNDYDSQFNFIKSRLKPAYYDSLIQKKYLPNEEEIARASQLDVPYGSLITVHGLAFVNKMINLNPIKIEKVGANQLRIQLAIMNPNEPAYFALSTQVKKINNKWERTFGGRAFMYLPENHPWAQGSCDLVPSNDSVVAISHDHQKILDGPGYPDIRINSSKNQTLPVKFEGAFHKFNPGVFTLESFTK